MATTIRVEDDVKEEFDRLQGYVQSETGERLSQSALLRRLIRVARRHEAGLFRDDDPAWRPPTPEEVERILSLGASLEERTDSSRIDDVVYSRKAVVGDEE